MATRLCLHEALPFAAVCGQEGAEASLARRGPTFSRVHCRRQQAGGGAGLAEGTLGQESGNRSPFETAPGAQLSETTCLPHVTSVSRAQNPLYPPPLPRTSMERSREFSTPLNGTDLSWAQKELFIRCSRHSVPLQGWPCSEARQTTFFLKAQFTDQLQSPVPRAGPEAPVWGLTSKGCVQVNVMSGPIATGLQGEASEDSPAASPWRGQRDGLAGAQPCEPQATASLAAGNCLK